MRAVHRACRRHCGHLLHARLRADACNVYGERAQSPLILNQEEGVRHYRPRLAYGKKENLDDKQMVTAQILDD